MSKIGSMAALGARPGEYWGKPGIILRMAGWSPRCEELNETRESVLTLFSKSFQVDLDTAEKMMRETPSAKRQSCRMTWPGQEALCPHTKTPRTCDCEVTGRFVLSDVSAICDTIHDSKKSCINLEEREAIAEAVVQLIGKEIEWKELARLICPHYFQMLPRDLKLIPALPFRDTPRQGVLIIDVAKLACCKGRYLQIYDSIDVCLPASESERMSLSKAKDIIADLADPEGHAEVELIMQAFLNERLTQGVCVSRLQKCIRSHSTKIAASKPFLQESVQTKLLAIAAYFVACTLPPLLDPRTQRAPSGAESAHRRLAISWMEDGLPSSNLAESLEVIAECLAIAKVCRLHPNYFCNPTIFKAIARHVMKSVEIAVYYAWDKQSPKDLESGSISTRSLDFSQHQRQICTVSAEACQHERELCDAVVEMIKDLKGFPSDIEMFESLQKDYQRGRPVLLTLEGMRKDSVPYPLLVDQHCLRGCLLCGAERPDRTAAAVWEHTGYNPLRREISPQSNELILKILKIGLYDIAFKEHEKQTCKKRKTTMNLNTPIPPFTLTLKVGEYKIDKRNSFVIDSRGNTVLLKGDKKMAEKQVLHINKDIINYNSLVSQWQVNDTPWKQMCKAGKHLELQSNPPRLQWLQTRCPQDWFLHSRQECYDPGIAIDYQECLKMLFRTQGRLTSYLLYRYICASAGNVIRFDLPDNPRGHLPDSAHADDHKVVKVCWGLHVIMPCFFRELRRPCLFYIMPGMKSVLQSILEESFHAEFFDASADLCTNFTIIDERQYRPLQYESIQELVDMLRHNGAAVLGQPPGFGKTKIALEAMCHFPGKLLFIAMNAKVVEVIVKEIQEVLGICDPAVFSQNVNLADAFKQSNVVVTTYEYIKKHLSDVFELKDRFNLIIDEFHVTTNPSMRTSSILGIASRTRLDNMHLLLVSATYSDTPNARKQVDVFGCWYSCITRCAVIRGNMSTIMASDLIITGGTIKLRPETWEIRCIDATDDADLMRDEAAARRLSSVEAFNVSLPRLIQEAVKYCEERTTKRIVIVTNNNDISMQIVSILNEKFDIGTAEMVKNIGEDTNKYRVVVGSGQSGVFNVFTSTNALAQHDDLLFFPCPWETKTMAQTVARLQRQTKLDMPVTVAFLCLKSTRGETLVHRQVAWFEAYRRAYRESGKGQTPKNTLPENWSALDNSIEEQDLPICIKKHRKQNRAEATSAKRSCRSAGNSY